MTPLERIQTAIDKLERLAVETVDADEVTRETMLTALRMMVPVRRILRNDLAMLQASEGEVLERVLSATERAGDLALADAINGETP